MSKKIHPKKLKKMTRREAKMLIAFYAEPEHKVMVPCPDCGCEHVFLRLNLSITCLCGRKINRTEQLELRHLVAVDDLPTETEQLIAVVAWLKTEAEQVVVDQNLQCIARNPDAGGRCQRPALYNGRVCKVHAEWTSLALDEV